MVKQGRGGRIISIVSTAAENARVNAAAYCASKAGKLQFTRVLAQELGQSSITANAVGPGLTLTGSPLRQPPSEAYLGALLKEVPLARPGRPRDIAQAVASLASPRAEYITGQVIYAEGGLFSGQAFGARLGHQPRCPKISPSDAVMRFC
ncbi:MAG: SDR family oxidoreductase [Chloroflexi bacterium]|nr:SDR family oxidoreductase [Chloroflexota bacterium]